MTYSNVRIVTSINGFKKLQEYINDYIKEHSGNKQLTNILDNDEKVLVFTQYKEMGTILEHIIEQEFNQTPLFFQLLQFLV